MGILDWDRLDAIPTCPACGRRTINPRCLHSDTRDVIQTAGNLLWTDGRTGQRYAAPIRADGTVDYSATVDAMEGAS